MSSSLINQETVLSYVITVQIKSLQSKSKSCVVSRVDIPHVMNRKDVVHRRHLFVVE